jgi:hypothetical protein
MFEIARTPRDKHQFSLISRLVREYGLFCYYSLDYSPLKAKVFETALRT